MGFEPTVPVRVRRFSRPFRYDHFGISPFVATIFYHIILTMSIDFLKLCLFFLGEKPRELPFEETPLCDSCNKQLKGWMGNPIDACTSSPDEFFINIFILYYMSCDNTTLLNYNMVTK